MTLRYLDLLYGFPNRILSSTLPYQLKNNKSFMYLMITFNFNIPCIYGKCVNHGADNV